jgi:hypothetical protein
MTAKDKAKQIVSKFTSATMTLVADYEWVDDIQSAKQCALITVDEILKSNPSYEDYGGDGWILIDNSAYWDEVKQEIELL